MSFLISNLSFFSLPIELRYIAYEHLGLRLRSGALGIDSRLSIQYRHRFRLAPNSSISVQHVEEQDDACVRSLLGLSATCKLLRVEIEDVLFGNAVGEVSSISLA